MKSITFRPLRRVKKTGKIVVAAYTQWNRVRTADYSAFSLVVDNEYAAMPADEFVYDHNGKQLFCCNVEPDSLPVFEYYEGISYVALRQLHTNCAIDCGSHMTYLGPMFDCVGTPAFSHLTADDIATHHFADITAFEPLTIGMVVKWFGWFLYNLENSSLQIGK